MNIRITFMLMALTAATTVQAAELGRLFYSQSERTLLERQHVLSTDESSNNSRALIVNGVIQRDGGKRIIWINGEQQAASPADPSTPATVPVILPGKSEPVKVKVGQRLMLDTANSPADSQSLTKPDPNDD